MSESKRIARRFLDYPAYWALILLAALFRSIPLSVGHRIADFCGTAVYPVLGSKKKIALRNLDIVYGDSKTPAEKKAIAVASVQNLFHVGLEIAYLPKILKNPQEFLNADSFKPVAEKIRERRGVIFLISHFGNWELMALGPMMFQIPFYAVARPINNQPLYREIQKLRALMGIRPISKKGAVKEVVQLLRAGKPVAMLVDQHERQGGVWVDFFGKKACTSALPAMMALKYHVPVIPFFFYRNEKGPSLLEMKQPFPVIRSGNYKEDVIANTHQYLTCLEREIEKRPGHWLWMHRRWRDRPVEKIEEVKKSSA